MRRRHLQLFACFAVLAGAIAMACGSSDDMAPLATPDGGTDAGTSPLPVDAGSHTDADIADARTRDAIADAADADSDTDAASPSDAGALLGPHQLAVGNLHACRIKDGAIKCWGRNDHGQLGHGTVTPTSPPIDVLGITNAVEVAAGTDFTCARLATGAVMCWGDGDSGKLGNNATSPSSSPVSVSGLTDAIAIAAGAFHACAIRANHHLVCWGYNNNRIGDGKLPAVEAFVSVPTEPSPAITDAIAVGGGWGHTCALRSNGTAKCWGTYNSWGQIGHGDKAEQPTPVDVLNLTTADQLELGTYHSCARLDDAAVQCWGNNQGGELGLGTRDDGVHAAPENVPGLPSIARLQVNGFGTCAITPAHVPYCWGYVTGNDGGVSYTPEPIMGLGPTVEIAGGGNHSCARLDSGEIWCWGDNQYGELGTDAGSKSDVPVKTLGL